MGLFARDQKIATFQIDFSSDEDVYIRFWSSNADPIARNIYFMSLAFSYLGKVLYNLNGISAPELNLQQGELPKTLISSLQGLLLMAFGTGRLDSEALRAIKPNLVPSLADKGGQKTYLAELWERPNGETYPQTPMAPNARGGEAYFAPMSVIALMKQLLINLPDDCKIYFNFGLLGILQFFQSTSAYGSIEGLVQAETLAHEYGASGLQEYRKAVGD